MGILQYQPFKALYLVTAIGVELARLPYWIVKLALPRLRQHPQWNFRQAMSVKFLRLMVYHIAGVRAKTDLPLTPGKEKQQFIVIEPADTKYYKGPLVSNNDVKPERIGGTWYPAPLTEASEKDNVTVVLHLHGGAFVTGDGRGAATGYSMNTLLKHGGVTHILAPQYRLSSVPVGKTSNPYPAAMQDTLSSYLYLVNTLKVSPSNIVLSGDSAGGNLSIALLRYIKEYGADLDIPNPSAAWLWSPWVNPSASTTDAFTRNNSNYPTDYLTWRFVNWGVTAYSGEAGFSILSSSYISSTGHPFKTEVPIWINTGGAEVLYFENNEFADEMRKAGNNVQLDVQADVPHDLLLVGNVLGMEGEVTASVKRAAEWLRETRKT